MDNKNEDTIVRQIEKSLSNNINENLFLTGRVLETQKEGKNSQTAYRNINNNQNGEPKELQSAPDYPLVSNDYISNSPVSISRAEYIRQAREACLRQMSNSQIYCNPYNSDYVEGEAIDTEHLKPKKERALRLFHEDTRESAYTREENTPQEVAAFRALIIRTVCAIVLFLLIFVVDKFDIVIGNITPEQIREYVTGNDSLQELEDIIVTWLK